MGGRHGDELVPSIYGPGERGWLKVKNRTHWKYELEREAISQRVQSLT